MWEIHSATDEKLVLINQTENHIHEIPWGAIGSWGELLGIEGDAEVLDAIISLSGTENEPDWGQIYEAYEAGRECPVLPAVGPVTRQGSSSPVEVGESQPLAVFLGRSVIPRVDPIGDALLVKAEEIEAVRDSFRQEIRGEE